MASPPLFMAILVVKGTSSSVTVTPTRQGPCSDSVRPEPTPEAISKPSWLWSAGSSGKRSKTPRDDLGKRWPRPTTTTAARTKFRGFQHSPWEYGTDQRRPGLPTRSQCREFLRELQKAPHRAKFSLSTGVGLWLGDHPAGDQCPTLGPEGAGFGQPFITSAQKVMFHGGVLRESGVFARQHGVLLLSIPRSGVKVCARLDRRVRVRVDRATT